MVTFREMARFLDPVEPATTMRELSGHHRWRPQDEPHSLRAMARRHTGDLTQRLVALNAYLMDLKGDDADWLATVGAVFGGPIGAASFPAANDFTKGSKPRVQERAVEIGGFLEKCADIALLCEVFTDIEKDRILDQWSTRPHHASDLNKFANNASGLLALSRKLSIEDERYEEYDHEAGKDKRSDKSVMLTTIDVGLGPSKLALYTTHLQAAGEKAVALKQVLELAKFIHETKDHRDVGIVAGDFNIAPEDANSPPPDVDVDGPPYSFRPDEILDVDFEVPDLLRRAVEETVADGTPRGAGPSFKPPYQIVSDLFAVLGFEDLWAIRNGSPGYTNGMGMVTKTFRERICPEWGGGRPACDEHLDERIGFCDDNVRSDVWPDGRQAQRIDYIFTSVPSREQSFVVDFTRPRRLRLERAPDAPGREDISFLSDHAGLWTTLRLVAT